MAVFDSYLSQIVLDPTKMKRLRDFISKLPEDIRNNEKVKEFYEDTKTGNRDKFTISFLIMPEEGQKVLLNYIHKLFGTNDTVKLDAEENLLLKWLTSNHKEKLCFENDNSEKEAKK